MSLTKRDKIYSLGHKRKTFKHARLDGIREIGMLNYCSCLIDSSLHEPIIMIVIFREFFNYK